MSGLTDAGFRLAQLQREVEDAETTLKSKKAALRDLAENIIPEMMPEDDAEPLPDGSSIVIEEEFHLTPAEKRRAETVAWLRSIKATKALTTRITVDIGKGLDETAQQLAEKATVLLGNAQSDLRTAMRDAYEDLNRIASAATEQMAEVTRSLGARLAEIPARAVEEVQQLAEQASLNEDAVTVDTGLAGATLRALLLDRYRKGHDVPEDIFGAYVARRARVVPPPQDDPVPL